MAAAVELGRAATMASVRAAGDDVARRHRTPLATIWLPGKDWVACNGMFVELVLGMAEVDSWKELIESFLKPCGTPAGSKGSPLPDGRTVAGSEGRSNDFLGAGKGLSRRCCSSVPIWRNSVWSPIAGGLVWSAGALPSLSAPRAGTLYSVPCELFVLLLLVRVAAVLVGSWWEAILAVSPDSSLSESDMASVDARVRMTGCEMLCSLALDSVARLSPSRSASLLATMKSPAMPRALFI